MVRIRDKWSTPAWVSAGVAGLVAVTLFGVSLAAVDERRTLVIVLGAGSLVVLAAGLVWRATSVTWAAVALLAAIGSLADTPAAPLYAVGLFTVAEAALSSAEERFVRVQDPGIHRDRLLLLAAVAIGSLVVGAAIRLIARDEGDQGDAYTVVAAACIVALVVLVVARARVAPRATTADRDTLS